MSGIAVHNKEARTINPVWVGSSEMRACEQFESALLTCRRWAMISLDGFDNKLLQKAIARE